MWLFLKYDMGHLMRKGPGRHDMWFRVICIWNHLLKMVAVIGFSFKERFLRCQLLFPDCYHFHHVIWGMKWAKKLKTKNGQNMSSGPFSHDGARILLCCCVSALILSAFLIRKESSQSIQKIITMKMIII